VLGLMRAVGLVRVLAAGLPFWRSAWLALWPLAARCGASQPGVLDPAGVCRGAANARPAGVLPASACSALAASALGAAWSIRWAWLGALTVIEGPPYPPGCPSRRYARGRRPGRGVAARGRPVRRGAVVRLACSPTRPVEERPMVGAAARARRGPSRRRAQPPARRPARRPPRRAGPPSARPPQRETRRGGPQTGSRPGCHAPAVISAAMPAARRRDSPYCRAIARCDSGAPAATDAR
jgi:hypothetical protein